MVKIGITVNLDSLETPYNNGLYQNIIILYELLNKIPGLIIYFITNHNVQKYKPFQITNKLLEMDFIIIMGYFLSKSNSDLCIKNGIKLIYYQLGNDYITDIHQILNQSSQNRAFEEIQKHDEHWISPHFEYSIDYYKYISGNNNVEVAPFFWKPNLLTPLTKEFDHTNINIGVFEPNLNHGKNCFIPVIICEKVKTEINKAYICNSVHLYDNVKNFREFANCSSLFKENRLTFEGRHKFQYVMDNYCNIVVSYVENVDLNYLFLECFYLGVPLIHNSKMLKDYGFYYEGCNVEMAAKHIVNIKKNGFNREEYIEKHKVLLYKYSIENPATIYFFKTKFLLEVTRLQ